MAAAIFIVALIALVCGVLLALAERYLHVPPEPRVERLAALLPGVNCGACGYAGCADFAKALAEKRETAGLCPVCDPKSRRDIAAVFDTDLVVEEVRRTALVLCSGSLQNAARRFEYNGIAECAAAAAVAGGDKACAYGCLGYGSCARACPIHAISIVDGLAKVDRERCYSCAKCAVACPRKIIRMAREGADAHVLCSSPAKGAQVRKVCANGCLGCRLCVKLAPDAFEMKSEFLAGRRRAKPLARDADELVAKCPGRCIQKT